MPHIDTARAVASGVGFTTNLVPKPRLGGHVHDLATNRAVNAKEGV
jgi:hypothetical protein